MERNGYVTWKPLLLMLGGVIAVSYGLVQNGQADMMEDIKAIDIMNWVKLKPKEYLFIIQKTEELVQLKNEYDRIRKEIIKIKGDFKIRLGMMNPNFAKEYVNDLIEILKSDKIFKFLHIPVQSGNNRILKKMNRKTKLLVDDYIRIEKELKKELDRINNRNSGQFCKCGEDADYFSFLEFGIANSALLH